MESILTSIKKLLGPDEGNKAFDVDIMIHINTALMRLSQIGIGPAEGFFITSELDTWEKFLGERKDIEAVKTLIYLKVRLVFDPPTNSAVIETIKQTIAELEWCLNHQAEHSTIQNGEEA